MQRKLARKKNMTIRNIHGQMVPEIRGELLTSVDQIFNQMLNETWPDFQREAGIDFVKGAYPRVDVIDEDEAIFIEAEVPGLSKKDVSVDVKDNLLTISGGRGRASAAKGDEDKKEPRYILKELKRSSFRRSFTLTDKLDASKIEAHFADGLLTIAVPKVKPQVPETRTIDIK